MMTSRTRWPILIGPCVFGLVLSSPPLRAQEPPTAHGAHAGEAEAEEREAANELAVFLGGTREEDEAHFTIGAEYERRLSERFGLVLVAENIPGLDAWVFLAPVSFRPVRRLGLKLYAGPGFETKEVEPEAEHPAATAEEASSGKVDHRERETVFVFRTGVGWALELGKVALTPQVELDFAREHDRWQTAFVFGIAVGFGF